MDVVKTWSNHVLFLSPNGEKAIEVVTELQLSNDPDPFWQHISLRDTEQITPLFPGNVTHFSAYEFPDVVWIDSQTVEIRIEKPFGANFDSSAISSRTVDGILFTFVIVSKEDRKNQFKTDLQRSENIDLGLLDSYSIRMEIERGGSDDVLSCPKLIWEKGKINDKPGIIWRRTIHEICGVLNVNDFEFHQKNDSLIVEMNLSRIGVMANGRLSTSNAGEYEIEISESNP